MFVAALLLSRLPAAGAARRFFRTRRRRFIAGSVLLPIPYLMKAHPCRFATLGQVVG